MAAGSGVRREDCVAQVCEISGLSPEEARPLLEATQWQVEEAIALHFATKGEDDEGQASPIQQNLLAAAVRDSDPSRPATVPLAASSSPSSPSGGAADEAAASQDQSGWFGSIGRRLTDLGQAIMGIASEDFEQWFLSRYGQPTPTFSKGCFGETVKAALQEKRLLLLWFHQDESRPTEHLCREILQNELVVEMVSRSFCLWAGDTGRFEPGQIARLLNVTVFPALVVCQPLRSAFEAQSACLEWPLGTFVQPLFRLTPGVQGQCISADEALAALTSATEAHNDEVQAREAQQARRTSQLAEERALREEQDREFEESLLQDQLAEVRRTEAAAEAAAAAVLEPSSAAEAAPAFTPAPDPAREEAKAAEAAAAAAAAAQAAEEEKRRERGAEILAEKEPAPDGSSTAKLSLRLPSGERLQRTFLAEQLLHEVYEWAHCCRASPEPACFELCTNFPTKVLTERSATLASLGLVPSAALVLKAVEA